MKNTYFPGVYVVPGKQRQAHVSAGLWKSLEALHATCSFKGALGRHRFESLQNKVVSYVSQANICTFKDSDVMFNTESRREG